MRIKILQLILIAALLSATAVTAVFAQEGADVAPQQAANQAEPASSQPGGEFFQPITQTGTSKINLVQNLPKGTWSQIIANVIKITLQITGTLAFLSFTVGGVLLVTAQGDEAKYKKGKSIIFLSILALIIIAASYAIVVGVTQLKFFQQ
jgi:hypothetical protein